VTSEITLDPVKKRTKTIISEGSSDALVGSDDLMTRSYDGRVIKTLLPDGTIMYSYMEKKATEDLEKFTLNSVTLIHKVDGTVIRIQQDGDITIMTGRERQNLNLKGSNLEFGKDLDYLFELNGKPSERKAGVYTCDLKKQKIWTKDEERNIFEIHADGTTKAKLSLSITNLEDGSKNIDDIRPVTPKYEGDNYLEPDVEHLDFPSNFYAPRLFVVDNNNTGYELFSEEQLTRYKYIKNKDIHTKYRVEEVENQFRSHTWLSRYFSINEKNTQLHVINNIKLPQRLHKIAQTPIIQPFAPKEIYIYRNVVESIPITNDIREQIKIALQQKDEWVSKIKASPLIDRTKIDEIKTNSLIQKRILQERQVPDVKFDADTIKANYLLPDFEEIKLRSILFDIEEHISEKERKRHIEDYSFRILPLNDHHIQIADILQVISAELEKKQKEKRRAQESVKLIENYFLTDIGKKHIHIDISGVMNKKVKAAGPKVTEEGMNIHDEAAEGALQDMTKKEITPIVHLENEKTEEDKKSPTMMKRKLLPSIYKLNVERQKEQEMKYKSSIEQWYKWRKPAFNYDMSERISNEKSPKYIRTTFPEAEFNEDYIAIEKVTDKRVKTSSVANRLNFHAPSINEIRKSGQHNFLLNALNRRSTYEEMMEKLNLMVTSELCDPLNKMLKIDPTSLDFGYIKLGSKCQMFINIRNDDNLSNRVYIKTSSDDKFIVVENFIGGKVNKY
jgi:hypothetical protein